MDPNSGRIYQELPAGLYPETDEEIEARGQIPIPLGKLREVVAMTPEQRMVWSREWQAAKATLNVHPAAVAPGESPEDTRKIRNARKRQRRAGR